MKVNKIIIIGVFLCFSIFTGCTEQSSVMTADGSREKEIEFQSEVIDSQDGQEIGKTESIYVYVCGYVKQPGVYQLASDSRICDALALAGGVLEDGRAEALNQAEHMVDGQTLYVPGKQENEEPVSEEDGLLDINAAGKEGLMTLPGIGESKADTIIQYREEHGPFQSIEDLMEIPGIKEGIFNKIRDYIKVSYTS